MAWSGIQDGSSMRLIAPLMQAEERWTMKEYPSEEMRVTYSLSSDMMSFDRVL